MKRDDIVKAFRFAAKNPMFSRDDMVEKGKIDYETAQYILNKENRGEKYFKQYQEDVPKFVLNVEGHLFLLQYESLEQARKDSKDARNESLKSDRHSRYALIIATVTLVISIIFSILQIIFK